MRAPASCGPIRQLRAVPIGRAILRIRSSVSYGRRAGSANAVVPRPRVLQARMHRPLDPGRSTCTTGVACPSPSFGVGSTRSSKCGHDHSPKTAQRLSLWLLKLHQVFNLRQPPSAGGMDKSAVPLHTEFGMRFGRAGFAGVPRRKPAAQPPSAGGLWANRRRWLKRPLCGRKNPLYRRQLCGRQECSDRGSQ